MEFLLKKNISYLNQSYYVGPLFFRKLQLQ